MVLWIGGGGDGWSEQRHLSVRLSRSDQSWPWVDIPPQNNYLSQHKVAKKLILIT